MACQRCYLRRWQFKVAQISALCAQQDAPGRNWEGIYTLLCCDIRLTGSIAKDVFSNRKKLQKKWDRGRFGFCTFWCWTQPCRMWRPPRKSSPILFLVSFQFKLHPSLLSPSSTHLRKTGGIVLTCWCWSSLWKCLLWSKWVSSTRSVCVWARCAQFGLCQ